MTSLETKLTHRVCKHCNSYGEAVSNGYIVCTGCGTTKDREFVDHIPLKTNSRNEVYSHNSIGKNVNFVGALGSNIGYSSGLLRGIRGQKLNAKVVNKYQRLRKFHHDRARLEGNATHLRTMLAFNRVYSQMELSKSIKQRALYIYWKQVDTEQKITNHVLLVALCMLMAIREAGEQAPVRFSEVVKAFAENGHRVTNKNILKLARELGVSLGPSRRKAEDYLPRIASDIRWDEDISNRMRHRRITSSEYEVLLVRISKKFLTLLDRKERGGVQPFPFAVSIMYLADRAYAKTIKRKPILTQKLLANAAKSAEFTIRDHVYRFLGDLYKQYEDDLVEYISELI